MRLCWFLILILLTFQARAELNLGDYGGRGNGVADNTTAFNLAVQVTCASSVTRTLRIPVGTFRFLSAPNPIACALNLVGEGKAVSRLVKDYSGGGGYFINYVRGQDPYGGGSIRNLAILAGLASSNGIAIWVKATPDTDINAPSLNRHGLLIDTVTIGRLNPAGGAFLHGIYLDGYYNNSPPGAAFGIRAITIRNTTIAVSINCAIYLYRGIGVEITSVDAYVGNAQLCLADSDGVMVWSRTLQPTVVINSQNVWKFP